MDLFLTQGFEETTLDTIAAAAAISKRTFFYYFTSKEEVLAAWQQGLPKEFKQALLLETPNGSPLDLVYRVQLRLMKDRDTGHARAVNRIIRENENLSATKSNFFGWSRRCLRPLSNFGQISCDVMNCARWQWSP
jgi:AcrR family transcriptional regulator